LRPKGVFDHRGVRIAPGGLHAVAQPAIAGERVAISGIGHSRAALDISTGLPAKRKKYHLAEGVGHYGIFNGSKWRERIAPVVEDWIRAHGG
jgi:poly(3-hydroxybutyrate) depolymerase